MYFMGKYMYVLEDKVEKGKLYLVGTQIGNLKDITLRGIENLKGVDIILAEDTRQTLKLLNHLEISKPMISYHRHNEKEKIDQVKKLLNEGKQIALVSDAGMPRVSDPGEALVETLAKEGYDFIVIPGVTAITTAICYAQFDTDRFVFEGFLPVHTTRRKSRLEELKYETRAIVFYEAPHKILYTLKDLLKVMGNREICMARELTKLHEEIRYSNLEDEINRIEQEGIKGEIVLILRGNENGITQKKEEENRLSGIDNLSDKELVERYIESGTNKKEAIKKVAKERGKTKNEVYMECV